MYSSLCITQNNKKIYTQKNIYSIAITHTCFGEPSIELYFQLANCDQFPLPSLWSSGRNELHPCCLICSDVSSRNVQLGRNTKEVPFGRETFNSTNLAVQQLGRKAQARSARVWLLSPWLVISVTSSKLFNVLRPLFPHLWRNNYNSIFSIMGLVEESGLLLIRHLWMN